MSEWKEIVAQKLAGMKIDGAHEGEIADELAQHVEDRYEEARAAGMDDEEARRIALEGLDDRAKLERELRSAKQWRPVEAPSQTGSALSGAVYDLRMAVRAARRRPAFSLTVVAMLALGIAGNAAIFGLFDALFLKPLPFRDSGQLVDLDERAPQWKLDYAGVSDWDAVAWRNGNTAFDGMAFYDTGDVNFSYRGVAQRARNAWVTRDMLDVLGLKPALGRNFTPEEDKPGGAKVVMLGYDFWQRMFQGRPGILGQQALIYNRAYTIVGVLPREAVFPEKSDLWQPVRPDPNPKDASWYLDGIGRLKHGVTYAQAAADLMRVHKGLIASGHKDNESTFPVLTPLRPRYLGGYRQASKVLLAAVVVVLLIACGNIAALMLVRSQARAREIAVRTAIGASRGRIVRQLLSENATLAMAGGIAGIVLGRALLQGLVSLLPANAPAWIVFGVDARFLVFAAAITLGAALLFGLAPALQAARVAPDSCLHGTRGTAPRGKRIALNALVAGEVALALALTICSGLLLRALDRVLRAGPGFRADNVLTFGVDLPSAKYDKPEKSFAFFSELLPQLRQLPGVRSAGAATALPFGAHWGNLFVAADDPPAKPGASNPVVLEIVATPGYIEAIGMTLVAGRSFNEHDGESKDAPVAIVNESFAREHWGKGNALGKRIRFYGNADQWMQVIGVIKDERHYGLDQPAKPSVLLPLEQIPQSRLSIAIHGSSGVESLANPARELVRRLDPDLPVYAARTMADRVRESLWARRAYSLLGGVFAAAALLLAAAGIYGVVSYGVAQRTSEIGIRMALGATPRAVLSGVLLRGMGLVAAGAVVGVTAAFAAAALLSGLLFGVSPHDPAVYLAMLAGIAGIGLLANLVPARRAAAIAPAESLKAE